MQTDIQTDRFGASHFILTRAEPQFSSVFTAFLAVGLACSGSMLDDSENKAVEEDDKVQCSTFCAQQCGS